MSSRRTIVAPRHHEIGKGLNASGSRGKGLSAGLLSLAAAAAVASLLGGRSAARADVYGNLNGATDLSQAASWFDETTNAGAVAPPGASDIARWDSLAALGAATTFTLGVPT